MVRAPMTSRRITPCEPEQAAVQIVVLHDDHLTASRGTLVADSVAQEMGLADDYGMNLWNIELLDTRFAPAAAADTLASDVLVVALRGTAAFSMNLKLWLRRWLMQTKQRSTAMIVVFENNNEMVAQEARIFLERAARSAGKEFFSQAADGGSSPGALGEPHEFLWVL
jgi:hypothetical protein